MIKPTPTAARRRSGDPWPPRHHGRRLAATALTCLALLLAAGAQAAEASIRSLGVDPQRATIDVGDVLRGGPPPQGIPALGFGGLVGVAAASPAPGFEAPDEARAWLADREPVILFRHGDEARIYPLQVLTWHEIANDVVGGAPVAVTYCPLCDSALAFDRRVPVDGEGLERLRAAGRGSDARPIGPDLRAAFEASYRLAVPDHTVEVTFGVSGLLYLSNLLMFDDGTGTLWSQLVGEGVVGDLAGSVLVRYPAQVVSFADALAAEPGALVLSRNTGFARDYGRNPYVGYDQIGSPAFLFDRESDGRLPAKARVVAIDGDEPVAYRLEALREARVLADSVAGERVVLLWTPGTASAIGGPRIATADDVGAVGVFRPRAGGHDLTLVAVDEASFQDEETESTWDVTGRAVAGPLAGEQLESVAHDTTLWFAWAAFRPETEVRP